MNDGYVQLDQKFLPINITPFKLNSKNKLFAYQAHLYYKALKEGDCFTGTYLDLSCGRGGGVDLARDNFSFSRVIGVDPNQKQIEFCKSWCRDIEFYVGSAIDIPIEDNSINVITSIEASGYYVPRETFLKECCRILKVGGKLIVAGRKSPSEKVKVPESINSMMKLTKIVDITNNVNISCAILKYALPLNLKDSDSKLQTKSVLFNDERKYISGQEKYLISVYERL
jgi:ubiquinone/menaquinone biosynthesis C-methylase UbiE